MGAAQLGSEAGAGQHVVQRSPLAIELIRIRIRPVEALVAPGRQGGDRIFLQVAVQVAQDQHIRIVEAGGRGGEPVGQFRGGAGAAAVGEALTVASVGIAAAAGTAALRLEMGNDCGELFAGRHAALKALEAHSQGGALNAVAALVEAAALKRRNAGTRRLADTIAAVEETNADLITAEAAIGLQQAGRWRDEAVGVDTQGGIKACHQLLSGTGGAIAIILEFVVSNDVGAQAQNGRDRLGTLPFKLRQVVGATRCREAAGRPGCTAAIAIEVIEQVETGDLQCSLHRRCCAAAGVGGDEVGRSAALHAIALEALIQNTCDARDRVAAAQRVAGTEGLTPPSVDHGVGVLACAAVIKDDVAILEISQVVRIATHTRCVELCVLSEALPRRKANLAIPS